MERAHIEYEKIRDKHEKLLKEMERLRQNQNHNPNVNTVNTNSLSPSAINPADKTELDRIRTQLEKALQVNNEKQQTDK
jgi:hypothetical protein